MINQEELDLGLRGYRARGDITGDYCAQAISHLHDAGYSGATDCATIQQVIQADPRLFNGSNSWDAPISCAARCIGGVWHGGSAMIPPGCSCSSSGGGGGGGGGTGGSPPPVDISSILPYALVGLGIVAALAFASSGPYSKTQTIARVVPS